MAPSISGHGGEFEIVEGKPTIDFTLPPEPRQVQIEGRDVKPRSPYLKPGRDPEWDKRPAGVPPTIKHPNDHDREEVEILWQTINEDFREEVGAFIIHSGAPNSQKARLPYRVRHYKTAATNQTMLIGTETDAAVRLEGFGIDAGQYIAVILYNFQEWPGPSSSTYDKIRFRTDTGIKEAADRDCYLYIAVASATEPTPHRPGHTHHELPGARLYINVNKTNDQMHGGGSRNDGSGQTLYHAEASAIHNSNLDFTKHEITLTTMKLQDIPTAPGGDVTFTLDAAGGFTLIKTGIYLIAEAPSDGSTTQTATAADGTDGTKQSALIDLNNAPMALMTTLQGIGPVLAERIDAYRQATPFAQKEDLMNVQGIGQVTYDRIKDQIQVLPA